MEMTTRTTDAYSEMYRLTGVSNQTPMASIPVPGRGKRAGPGSSSVTDASNVGYAVTNDSGKQRQHYSPTVQQQQPTTKQTTTAATAAAAEIEHNPGENTTESVRYPMDNNTIPEGYSLHEIVQIQDSYIRSMLAKVRILERKVVEQRNITLELQHIHHLWHLQELYEVYRAMGIDEVTGPLEVEEEFITSTAKRTKVLGSSTDEEEDTDNISVSSSLSGMQGDNLGGSAPRNSAIQYQSHPFSHPYHHGSYDPLQSAHISCERCRIRFSSYSAYYFHMTYSLLHDRRNAGNWVFCSGCKQYYPVVTRDRHVNCASMPAQVVTETPVPATAISIGSTVDDWTNAHSLQLAPSTADIPGKADYQESPSSSSQSSTVTASSKASNPQGMKRKRSSSNASTGSKKTRKYECVECDQVFKSHTAMSSHMRFSLQHDPNNIKNWNYCAVCDKKYHPRVGTRHKQCRLLLKKMEEEQKKQVGEQEARLRQLAEEETIALQQLNALRGFHDPDNPITTQDEREVATEDDEDSEDIRVLSPV